jgi:hypothetical protein
LPAIRLQTGHAIRRLPEARPCLTPTLKDVLGADPRLLDAAGIGVHHHEGFEWFVWHSHGFIL